MLPDIDPAFYQEYRTAKGWRLFIYLLVPPLALAFLAGPFFFWQDSQQRGATLVLSGLMLGLAAFFIYGLLETYKAKHIITADSLIYEGVLRRKVIPLAHLRGFRSDQQYTRFFSTDPADPSIRIGYTSENYAAMQQWFADRYPDLDQQDQAAAAARLLADHQLGASPEVREATLASARQTARCLNIAGGVVAGWLFLLPAEHYRWAMGLGIGIPLLAAAVLWWHAGVLRPDEQRNSAYPSVAGALLGPGLLLLLRVMLDFELLAYAALWPWVAGVAAAFTLLVLGGSRRFVLREEGRVGLVLTTVFLAALYGFGATMAYNCAFDQSPATRYQAPILNKHSSSGRTTTYYLYLGPWGPRAEAADVSVDADFYQRRNAGNRATVYLRPGRLHVPWFVVGD